MKQEIRAAIDVAASHRAAHIMKQDPTSKVTYSLDDITPRAVVQVVKEGKVIWLEFVESAETAGKPDNMEDYVSCAGQLGGLTIHFPESNYSKDIALTIFNDIAGRIKGSGINEFKLSGYIYDNIGSFKKVR
jgi:hypothetical protein